MIRAALALAALLSAALSAAAADVPADKLARFHAACEEAQARRIAVLEAELAALREAPRPDEAQRKKIAAAERELAAVRARGAGPVAMPMPPQPGDIGAISAGAVGPDAVRPAAPTAVRILEIIDEDDAIVRLKYNVAVSADDAADFEPTFVDVWLHGPATGDWSADDEVEVPGVFTISGNRSFETTCGGRSVLLLEPVDLGARSEPGNESSRP